MVVVAQLVRAPDCGSGGRRFETDLPPKKTKPFNTLKGFFCSLNFGFWYTVLLTENYFFYHYNLTKMVIAMPNKSINVSMVCAIFFINKILI